MLLLLKRDYCIFAVSIWIFNYARTRVYQHCIFTYIAHTWMNLLLAQNESALSSLQHWTKDQQTSINHFCSSVQQCPETLGSSHAVLHDMSSPFTISDSGTVGWWASDHYQWLPWICDLSTCIMENGMSVAVFRCDYFSRLIMYTLHSATSPWCSVTSNEGTTHFLLYNYHLHQDSVLLVIFGGVRSRGSAKLSHTVLIELEWALYRCHHRHCIACTASAMHADHRILQSGGTLQFHSSPRRDDLQLGHFW